MTPPAPFLEQKHAATGPDQPPTLEQQAHALGQREAAVDTREALVEQREKAVLLQEDAARAKEAQELQNAAQLREANERLVVATVQAQTMKEAAENSAAQMSYMAQHDILTGLPNRALLTDRLAQAMALAQRHDQKIVLLYLDLDNFKHINDSLGHSVGDELLQAVARRLSGSVRQSDTVCRQGGDEFVLLLTEVDTVQHATHTAAMLIETTAQPYQVGSHTLQVSASIGLSIYPDDGNDVETLLHNADTAMYHAKKSGRNNFQLFSPDMDMHAMVQRSKG
ncbi:GGDEF domain-containing protein [Rhodoferax sp.]|uniref:GGDEF domain-containing protein n=1 Tax=Rhodoferax sp. TaxID=50421 RepID=UPI0025CE6416|nr:GGDEF domain-containing protein [Rhodoferax sp.]